KELMRKHLRLHRLSFSSDPKIVADADWVVIAYDSPVNDRDEVDVTPMIEAARTVAPLMRPGVPIVITSQLPLSTSENIESIVRDANTAWRSGVVYVPENLRLGTALACFLKPDMIVLGANDVSALRAAQTLYRPFRAEKLPMDLRSAEMVKHALNTFLATSIAFINEMANI